MGDVYKIQRRLRNQELMFQSFLRTFNSNDPVEVKQNQIAKLEPSVGNTVNSVHKKQFEILCGLWRDYREPDMRKEDCVTNFEKHKAMIERSNLLRQQEAFLATGTRMPVIGTRTAYTKNAPATLSNNDGSTRGINPETGDYSILIVYTGDVDYAKFKNLCKRSNVDDKPEVFVSIKNLLDEAQKKGMNRSQAAELLHGFSKTEFPRQHNPLNPKTDESEKVAHAVFHLVRSTRTLEAVQRAINAFKRSPGTSIFTTHQDLLCLYVELIKIKRPFQSTKKTEEEADDWMMKTIKDLMSPEASARVAQYITECDREGETLKLDEIIEYCEYLEEEMGLVLNNERSLTQKSITLVAFSNELKKELSEGQRSRREKWDVKKSDPKDQRATTPSGYSRQATPRGGSTEKGSSRKNPTNEKRSDSKSPGPVRRQSGSRPSSRPGSRNRSRSNSKPTDTACLICGIPSCNNRDTGLGACPNLSQVRYNPSKFCGTCFCVGHFSTGDPCKEVVKKKANFMLSTLNLN